MTIRSNKKTALGGFFAASRSRSAARQSLHVPPPAAHTRTCGNACAKHYHDRYVLPLPDHAMHCQLYGNLSASHLMVQPSTASGRRLHPIKPVNFCVCYFFSLSQLIKFALLPSFSCFAASTNAAISACSRATNFAISSSE